MFFVSAFDGCLHEFKSNDRLLPFTGSTARFDIVAVGTVSKTCPGPTLCRPGTCATGEVCKDESGQVQCVATSPSLGLGLILVIVFFIILLIAIVISVIVLRYRRQNKPQTDVTTSDLSLVMGAGDKRNVSGNSNPSFTQDSGFNENGTALPDEYIRQHIATELATMKYSEREVAPRQARPDVIEPDLMNTSGLSHMEDGTVIIENGEMLGLDDMPEHYDLENASSIAPSDIDIVKHYKNYRKHQGLPPYLPAHFHHQHNNHHHQHHRHNVLQNRAIRESPLSVSRQQSPNILLADSPALKSTPVRQSPMSFGGSSNRPSPLPVSLAQRQSPLNQLSRQQPRTAPSPLSLPMNMPSSPVIMLNGQPQQQQQQQQQTAKDKQRRRQRNKLKTRGLTVDEINRLNARPRVASPVSTIDGVSSTDGGDHPPLYKDIYSPPGALLEPPPDSSSDEGSNDSFTCSEFEYDNDKVRNDQVQRFPQLPEVDNENDSAPESNRSYSDSRRSGSVSTFFASDDEVPKRRRDNHKPINGFNWDYLLNWGPNFEKLVGVFEDIAELPDSEVVMSPRSTPRPVSRPPTASPTRAPVVSPLHPRSPHPQILTEEYV